MNRRPKMIKYGPMWQWECPRCHEMGDCFDTPQERDKDARRHQCAIDNVKPAWEYVMRLEDFVNYVVDLNRGGLSQKALRVLTGDNK